MTRLFSGRRGGSAVLIIITIIIILITIIVIVFIIIVREEGRECGAPVSRISRCMATSQALFNFEVMR